VLSSLGIVLTSGDHRLAVLLRDNVPTLGKVREYAAGLVARHWRGSGFPAGRPGWPTGFL